MDSVIRIDNLRYRWHASSPWLLDIPQWQLDRGQRVFLRGPSGSGKSSLLALLCGIQTPQQGRIELLDTAINQLSATARDHFRAQHLGIIFQQFNLLPYLSVIDNVLLGVAFSPARAGKAKQQRSLVDEAKRLLSELQLPSNCWQRPVTHLSIGQQQRVAAARALLGRPELIIADEPTSSLDSDRRHAFIELLFSECQQHQTSLLFVSHDNTLAENFDQVIDLTELNQVEVNHDVAQS